MRMTEIQKLWAGYDPANVSKTIHPADVMYNASKRPEDYYYCGESGIEVISAALGAAPTLYVGKILDFGCGYGRVGRYLRALFPSARITFSEIDHDMAKFCSDQFRGEPLVTPKDFDQLTFPDQYDVIWLGSIFTHIDYQRMQVLFAKLFGALRPSGILIGTFRGNKMFQTYSVSPEAASRDAALIEDYKQHGVAYKRYAGWSDDWGLSLVKPQKLMDMGQEHPTARMVMYSEVGWASAHDVVAWTNTTPGTVIG